MSGGSMEYLCYKVADAEFEDNTPLRKLFRAHLKLVAKALHDIEWVDSSDYGPGDEDDAILDVLKNDITHDATRIAQEYLLHMTTLVGILNQLKGDK